MIIDYINWAEKAKKFERNLKNLKMDVEVQIDQDKYIIEFINEETIPDTSLQYLSVMKDLGTFVLKGLACLVDDLFSPLYYWKKREGVDFENARRRKIKHNNMVYYATVLFEEGYDSFMLMIMDHLYCLESQYFYSNLKWESTKGAWLLGNEYFLTTPEINFSQQCEQYIRNITFNVTRNVMNNVWKIDFL